MSDAPTLVWGAAHWLGVAAGIAALVLALLAWGYWRAGASRPVRVLAMSLKALGVLVLALCLLEPLFSGTRARPGANLFVVLADNSQSMTLRGAGDTESRGDKVRALTRKPAGWLARLGQDFDLRQHAFDTQLRTLPELETLAFDGGSSNLGASLDRLVRRYHGRPLAGVLLFTDGSATDAEAVEKLAARAGEASAGNASAGDTDRLPPIYPVLLGDETPAGDVSVQRVAVSQTNFEDAPVTLVASIATSGYEGRTIDVALSDAAGKSIEQQTVKVDREGKPLTVRFRLRPEQPGVSFYRVSAAAQGEAAAGAAAGGKPAGAGPEATLANNSRLVTVDRGRGPYRVLYVCGRPNWEFKFFQRAVQEDDQVRLDALLRIAKREPKFNFLSRRGEETNPLYRGFEHADKEQAETYDQPVLVRMMHDENALPGGFPKTPEELYPYHAVILDDIEAEFFTQDQMQLLKEFVRQRGGGLLMLGGQESFKNGKFDRTPVGDLLPVYVDEVPAPPEGARYRLALTREGWLEPWVRLRADEDAEGKRLGVMPPFQTLNQVRGIKPGATVLASADVEGGGPLPALVEHRFGQGRVGAMLIGDLWRWGIRRPENTESDLDKAWRQTVRWLVADVPQRVEAVVESDHGVDNPDGTVTLAVRVRDATYAPLDNAAVAVKVTGPDGKVVQLTAEASGEKAGLYEASYVPRQPGAYRAEATVAAPDGSEAGKVEAGWTSDPAAEEFRELRPNKELLRRIAAATGGQVVNASELDAFVTTLPTRHAQVTEPYVRPVWHQPWVFLLAILCLTAEWGLRRWKGLP
jgi:uncharacterized membrane protein